LVASSTRTPSAVGDESFESGWGMVASLGSGVG